VIRGGFAAEEDSSVAIGKRQKHLVSSLKKTLSMLGYLTADHSIDQLTDEPFHWTFAQ
jgi:hypothetical protein